MSQHQLFSILDVVESTNNYAMAKVHAGLAVEGEAFFARDQWGGKGQRGNKWESKKDENLIMTIIFKPDNVFKNNLFFFNAFVVSTCNLFFSEIAGAETFIKWPNDIYYNDRKAGGILIENIFIGQKWAWAIVGIGININQKEFDIYQANATSLSIICKRPFDQIELGKKLHSKLITQYEHVTENSEDYYFNYFNNHLYKKGKTVKLKKGNIVFNTCIKGVNKNGELITFDNMEKVYKSGDVKWVL